MSANGSSDLVTEPTPHSDPIALRAAKQASEVTIYDPEALDNGNRGAWISATDEWVGERRKCR